MGNVLIAAIAVILFAGFVLLATKGGNKDNDNLSAVAPTSTSERPTTTTTEPAETTTTAAVAQTTTTLATPGTTTATTAKKSTTGTTAKRTTTTTGSSGTRPSGRQTILADNDATFTQAGDGSCTGSSTTPSGPGSDQVELTIDMGPRKADHNIERSSHNCDDPANSTPQFIATLTNRSNKPLAFPGGNAVVTVILRMPGSSDIVFTISAGGQPPLQPGESIALTQTNSVPPGTFAVSASADVDYG